MKNINKMIVATTALCAGWTLFAAPGEPLPPEDGQRPPPPPRPPPIIAALDANKDGQIDADEIANASATLLQLDKNGDGVLTPDEFIGPRPPGPRGPRGPEGPRESFPRP